MRFERQAWSAGCARVAGVDEAGRGPLAGPVMAAAVIFDRTYLVAQERGELAGLTDSKKLSPAKREHFFALLAARPGIAIGVGRAEVGEVDRLNILRATHLAMARALAALPALPDHALVDGLPVPGLPCPSTAVVGGDGLSLSIAAASIVAKVTRDRLMEELDRLHPGYGLARHKGYGTREHLEALRRLGPSPCHRRSFAPVSQLVLPFSTEPIDPESIRR
ncbi:MAG: ribonuclease HII [Kiritimatiellae bacterium]|nr:ribonuclease HII [Kiritimatiellia bacterium]